MITFSTIKENAKKAYEQDQMFQFIMGYDGYDLRVIDAPVDVPTDWTRIIPHGIFALYDETKDENIIRKYEEAITKAVNGNLRELWSVTYVLFVQARMEKQKRAPFEYDRDASAGITDKIINAREELSKEYPFGKDDESMYEDILRLNSIFKEEWNESFLN